jgi:hypothetical protein
MPARLPLKNVAAARNLVIEIPQDPDGSKRFEIYSGTVAVGWQDHSGTLQREEFTVLVPVEDTTVRLYFNGDLNQKTVMVALGGYTGDDDEENLASVDDFNVRLEPQSFASVGGTPPCLVLRFSLALLNGAIHRVSYNISLLMPPDGKIESEDVGGDARPQ